MSLNTINRYLNELKDSISRDDKDLINILEKKLAENYEKVYHKIQFYELPYENLLQIISNVDFNSFDDLFHVLETTIEHFIRFHEDQSYLLLKSLKLENCEFTLDEYINILINFTSIPILLSLKQFIETNDQLPERDYPGEIEKLNKEISSYKLEIEAYKKKIDNLNHKISDSNYIRAKLSINQESRIKNILNAKKFRELKLWEKTSTLESNPYWADISDEILLEKLGNAIQEADRDSEINEVLLLLDSIDWKRIQLESPQFIYLISFIKSSKFFVALKEALESDLVDFDYEYELQMKDKEIADLKREKISK